MSKQEFLSKLRAALNGRIPAPQVEDTINYYEDYINVEVRKGRSEEEVLKSLGDPRLIARTIIQTNGTADSGYNAGNGGYRDNGYRDNYRDNGYRERGYQDSGYQDFYGSRRGMHKRFGIPGWLLAIIVIFVLVLVVCLVFSVLSFLAPLIIVMAAVVLLVKVFRDWLN